MDFDYLEFYRQIDQAYKELIDIKRAFSVLWRRFKAFSCRLEELARDAENIKDEEKRESFESVLSSLSEQSHECDERWHDISANFDNAHYYDFVELVAMAEEGLKGKGTQCQLIGSSTLVPMAKEEEEKGLSEADNN